MSKPSKRPSRLLVLLAVLAGGCDFPGRPNPADRPVPADQVMDFAVLYRQNCAGCHGKDGTLGPAPPLKDPLFRALVSREELEDILQKGRKNTLMPAFAMENGGPLTRAQVQVLVMEIKGNPYKVVETQEVDAAKFEVVPDDGGITPSWGTPARPPKDAPLYGTSVATRDSGHAEKGAAAFARACAVCHGSNGQGIEKAGAMRRTINDRVFLALLSNQALRRYAITGRPDLGMPSFNAARPDNPHFVPLTDQEVTDLVALLASWRGDK